MKIIFNKDVENMSIGDLIVFYKRYREIAIKASHAYQLGLMNDFDYIIFKVNFNRLEKELSNRLNALEEAGVL